MIFAVTMSVMLMPAQMMAKNNNAKPKIENRVENRKENKKEKFDKARPAKPVDKKFKNDKPAKRPKPMAMKKKPGPRPRPVPPPAYKNNCCANNVVETVATVVGIAALAALIVD